MNLKFPNIFISCYDCKKKTLVEKKQITLLLVLSISLSNPFRTLIFLTIILFCGQISLSSVLVYSLAGKYPNVEDNKFLLFLDQRLFPSKCVLRSFIFFKRNTIIKYVIIEFVSIRINTRNRVVSFYFIFYFYCHKEETNVRVNNKIH